ncbi:MAG: hypothetical protein ACLTQI_05655 [Slackia sp.]
MGVGNGAIAGGPFMAIELQQDAGIDFSVEEAFNHIMEYGHWSTNAAAIKKAVELSGSTVDQFTEEFGVPTGLRPDNYGAGHASVRCNFQSDPKDSKTQKKGVDRMGPLSNGPKAMVPDSCSTPRAKRSLWKMAYARAFSASRKAR